MDIGKLFRDAWGLFVKDIGPLIVGILIASIVPAVAAVVIAAAGLAASIRGLQVDSEGTVTGVESVNWALLVIGAVAILVVALFLTVPLYVGILSGVIRRVREGRQMAYGDAFSGFGLFGRVIWAAVLLSLIFAAIFLVPTAVIVGGAVAGSGILAGLGVLVLLVAMVPYAYLLVAWAYVFPVIVDRGLGVTESMAESRRLVHGTGWWWTFLMLFVLQLVVGAVSAVLGLIPVIGAVATIVLYPFVLTYVVAMYFQARGEGQLVDAVLGWPRQAPAGPPAYSSPFAPGAGQAAVTAATAAPAVAPPPRADADAWKAAADPLAAPPSATLAPPPPVAPHEHAAIETPTVDAASGQLQTHCSACGALIEGSDEFCQACALEVSGGEPPVAEPPAVELATGAPPPPEAPAAPEEPKR